MPRWHATVPLLVLCAAVPGVPPAAQPAAARPAAGPPEVLLPDGKTPVPFDKNKAYKLGRVAYGGFAPLRQPGGDKTSGAPPLKFMQKVRVIGDFEQGIAKDGQFLPVAGLTDNAPIGWVPKNVVVFGAECMVDEAYVHIKAMVINSYAHLSDKTIPADKKLAPPLIRLGPSEKAADVGPIRFFDFFFVWADTDRDNPNRGYALLGDRSGYNKNKEVELNVTDEGFPEYARILGWVDKSRLCFWRTREAVQWNDQNPKRGEPVRTYPGPDTAVADLNGDPPPPNQPATVVEEMDAQGRPVRWEAWRMRYPVLFHPDPKHDGGGWSSKKFFPRAGGNNTLYNVGVIGDVFDAGGNQLFKRADRAAFNRDLQDMDEQINNLQILFVIDRTDSMQNYWVEAARSVERLIEQVKKDGRATELAFCYYGDKWLNGQEGTITDYRQALNTKGAAGKDGLDYGVVPGKFFSAADAPALKAALAKLGDKADVMSSGSRLEMVYAGLEAGLMECGTWKAKARKMVVLLGDDGNHSFAERVEKDIHDRVATFLARGGSRLPPRDGEEERTPIEFYALQVAETPADADAKHPRRMFQAQVEALRDAIRAKPKAGRADYFNPVAARKDFQETIKARYDELQKRADQIRAFSEKVRTGQVTTKFQITDPEAERLIMDVARRYNPTRPEALLEGSQVFESRYVWLTGPRTGAALGDRQIRSMVLVSDGELKAVLSTIDNFFEDGETTPTLESIAAALIQIHSGALQGEERKADLDKFLALSDNDKLVKLKVARGFQFAGELSKYLGYADGKGGGRAPTQAEKATLIGKMRDHYYKLKGIRKDLVYVPRGGGKWEPTKPEGYETRKFRKGFDPRAQAAGAGKESDEVQPGIWYWIDVDEEWL